MNNLFEATYAKAKGFADLTNDRPDIGEAFFKVIQGVYLTLTKYRYNASKVHLSTGNRNGALILTITGSGQEAYSIDLNDRRNRYYAKIAKRLQGFNGILNKLVNYGIKHDELNVVLSPDSRIIITGKLKAGENE